MFLRFVNPAIVSPYEAGILEKKPLPRIERGLKLMSKVRHEKHDGFVRWDKNWIFLKNLFYFYFFQILQSIANHVLFTKEEHMRPFNDFVKSNFDAARR